MFPLVNQRLPFSLMNSSWHINRSSGWRIRNRIQLAEQEDIGEDANDQNDTRSPECSRKGMRSPGDVACCYWATAPIRLFKKFMMPLIVPVPPRGPRTSEQHSAVCFPSRHFALGTSHYILSDSVHETSFVVCMNSRASIRIMGG